MHRFTRQRCASDDYFGFIGVSVRRSVQVDGNVRDSSQHQRPRTVDKRGDDEFREQSCCAVFRRVGTDRGGLREEDFDESRPDLVDLRDVRCVRKQGGTIDDTELTEGIVFAQKAAKGAGAGIHTVEDAKIALIQFCISPPKTDMENNVIVSDYTQMDRILKEERNYVIGLIKKIKATGCNVLLIQKSILRER